jgi:predicted nucleic acid-binding protein
MASFIDTNIFIYAHDETNAQKSKKARSLIIDLIESNEACISTQVIQEFCNVALKKAVVPLKITDVKEIITVLMSPLLSHQPDLKFYSRALKLYEQYSLNFYDALIIQAAIDLNCSVIYSEDLQNGTHYRKVKVVNPF